jgi:hypothetical protein
MADDVTFENTAAVAAAQNERWRRPLLQPALRVIAETGWITVLYAAGAVMVSHQAPVLGPLELLAFVLAGVLVGWLGRSRADVGPVLLIVGVGAGGAVGWLASSEARFLLSDLPRAFDVHLAGWLAGIAVLRGALIDTGERAAEEIEKLLRSVPVWLVVIWAYVEIAARPILWLPFATMALWGTVGFLTAAAVSIGLARLKVLHAGVTDQVQRRGWRWLVIVIGFGIVPVAVPIAVLSGIPVAALLNPVTGPLQLVLGLLAIVLGLIVWVLSELLRPFAGPLGGFLDELETRMNERRPAEPQPVSDVGTIIGLALWALTIFLVLLAIFYVARWLLRRKGPIAEDLADIDSDTEHAIVVPAAARRPGSRGRGRRMGVPHDVVAAYLAALAELESHVDLARLPNETPAQHAARLRSAGIPGSAELGRLAAGYQLARYGERRITTPENVRAVGRFQRLRRMLRASAA